MNGKKIFGKPINPILLIKSSFKKTAIPEK
jgi:hypothetical protein